MTRTMGDATHDNVAALAAAPGLELVAGYVTGGPTIRWTPADWAMFAGRPVVTIDQGFTGSPVMSADVRDVEPGAWTPAAAVNLAGWTAARPTLYCSLSTVPAIAQAGWSGDVWVADYTGTPPAAPSALPHGMTCVAVQYSDQGGGGAYDLSVVFDPYWPGLHPDLEDKVLATAQYSDGRLIVALGGADGNVYVTEQDAPGGKWVKSGPVGGPVGIAGAVTFSLEVANDAPGVFVASADPVASDNGEVWTTWKRADGSWAAWAQIA